MSTKKLLVLTGVFLLLLGFVIVFERHQPTSDEVARAARRFLDFKPEDVTAATLERLDLPKVELSRSKGEGRWALTGQRGGPADANVVDALLKDLSRLDMAGEPWMEGDPKEFGLDRPKAKVTLVLQDGSRKTISLGKEIPGLEATAAADGKRFGAVKYPPTATLTKPLDEFRAKTLFEGPAADVTSLTILRGPARITVTRDLPEAKTKGLRPWRLEAPVKDLAAGSFVDQLLADLAAVKISDWPILVPAELPRVGLQPEAVSVTLSKGAEMLSRVVFGAAKADTVGKLYARRDDLVVVIDDRILESLNKEFSAFREGRVLSADAWDVTRVSFESEGMRTGAERVEGEWRSAGVTIGSTFPEELIGKVLGLEARRFVSKKEYGSVGLSTARGKTPVPAASIELVIQKESSPRTVKVFGSPLLTGEQAGLVEVTGRPDGMLVDKAALDEVKALAAKLRTASTVPPRKTPIPTVVTSPSPPPGPGKAKG